MLMVPGPLKMNVDPAGSGGGGLAGGTCGLTSLGAGGFARTAGGPVRTSSSWSAIS